jgi:hypothetical protein
MKYRKFLYIISLFAILVSFCLSCGSRPESANAGTTRGGSNVSQNNVFDPTRVSREQYVSTREEVQQFIEGLNRIIQNRNYEAWKAALSPDHFAEISSKENLDYLSESPAMVSRRIVLRTPEDYFIHVVVPSRANSRVDDIEFISENRVKAFTINTNRAGEEVWLRLYDLEKINNTWTIIN